MTILLLNFFKKHPLLLALILSTGLHGLAIFWQWIDSPTLSSLGTGQVLLLEHVPELPAKNEYEPETKIKSQQSGSVSKDTGLIGPKEKVETTSNKNLTEVKSDSPVNKQAGAPKSKGSLVDQSGKAPTASDLYQQQVLQHILKKAESSRFYGAAVVKLHIISVGFATQVEVIQISGDAGYGLWLKGQVLNANPMPKVPKELGSGGINLEIQISHVLDDS